MPKKPFRMPEVIYRRRPGEHREPLRIADLLDERQRLLEEQARLERGIDTLKRWRR